MNKFKEKVIFILSYFLFSVTMFLLVNELFLINELLLNYKFKYSKFINFEFPFSVVI